MLRCLSAISLVALSVSVAAQDVDESDLDTLNKATSVAARSLNEPTGAVELRAAMRRIAYSPTDADALADAGNAALTLGDANAALNFFARANNLRPNNGRIISGLASATVRTENPFEALRLFDDAIRLGVGERAIAGDRALAFDLLGNFIRAQQDYRLARSISATDDLLIRQAVSMSLAGQAAEADGMLVPLLKKNSVAAWRARAFMLAARGEFRESTKVTQGFMDQASAQRMERYLRLMPDLTGAQQAAAIHLGHFPASQYVGRDSDQVRRVAANIAPVEPSKGESRLIPAGSPLGPKTAKAQPVKEERKRDRKTKQAEEVKIAAAAIPESIRLPKTDRSRLGTETARTAIEQARNAKIALAQGVTLPPPETARPLVNVPSAVTAESNALPKMQPEPGFSVPGRKTDVPGPAVTVAAATLPETVSTQAPSAFTAAASNSVMPKPMTSGTPIADASVAIQTAPAIVEARPSASMPVVAPAFDLAAIVGAIKIPENEQKQSTVPVDLKKIKPTLPKSGAVQPASKSAKIDPKLAAKAKIEAANPSRNWVQIATGQASALPFDYRKWAKKSPELFKKQEGWTAAWGKTGRLLVGPFADMKAAKKWEVDFKKAGGDSFTWKSEAGDEVVKLKTK